MSSRCVANDSASPRRLPCFDAFATFWRWGGGGGEGRFLVGTIRKLKCHEKTSWTWEIYLFRSRNNIKQPTQGWVLMTFEECSATDKGATLVFVTKNMQKSTSIHPLKKKGNLGCNQPIMNPLAFLNAKKISIY